MKKLRGEASALIAEQLVLVIGDSPLAEEEAHRLRVLDLCCPDGRLVAQYKRTILFRSSTVMFGSEVQSSIIAEGVVATSVTHCISF